MLARFKVLLPYSFNLLHRETLLPYNFEAEGYKVKAYPPKQANVDSSASSIYSSTPILSAIQDLNEALITIPNGVLKVNGQETVQANLIQLDIWSKEDFYREDPPSKFDPSLKFIFNLVNVYIQRLRTIGRLAKARPFAHNVVGWKIEYLNDDGGELEEESGKLRILTSSAIEFELLTLTQNMWEKNLSLSPEYIPPVWDTLILDALALAANEINASIVLANAALESLINHALNVLVKKSNISEEFWKWIRERGDNYQKQPSVKENFDEVLCLACGVSLKIDAPDLWTALDELRSVRNSIVHEGKAILIKGKKKKRIPVDFELAQTLLQNAQKIIIFVEKLLPESERRPFARGTINSTISKNATGENVNPKSAIIGLKLRPDVKEVRFGNRRIK